MHTGERTAGPKGSVHMSDTTRSPGAIGRAERWSLRLVFGGPVSLWVPLARLVGVRVDTAADVDDAALAGAEAGAREAAQRFGAGLMATTVCTVALLVWLPVQARFMGPLAEYGFLRIEYGILSSGGPFGLALAVAAMAWLLAGLLAGLLNAAVFGGIPLVLLRRCTVAAAPAVSIAMTQGDAAFEAGQAEAYPRVAFAAQQILHPRRWGRA